MLKPLTVQRRGANKELEILFHRNDHKDIYGRSNNGPMTKRQPDVIVTSVHSARRAAGPLAAETWLLNSARDAPHFHFQ